MADEIRRRKTSDPEMDAMMVLAQAFNGLDRNTIDRVLKWAEARYVKEGSLMSTESMKALTQFQDGIVKIAKNLNAPPRDVLNSMAKVADKVEEEASV